MDETAGPLTQAEGLFEAPRDRLGKRLHEAVFGPLPSSLARACDVPEVAEAVRPLLTRGWRPAQLSARIGALPPPVGDPVPAVVAFLDQLLERSSPQEAWDRERAARQVARSGPEQPVASDEDRARWVAQARRALGMPPRPRPVERAAASPTCASCPGEGTYFVTRRVRLCEACVALLSSGRAHLGVSA